MSVSLGKQVVLVLHTQFIGKLRNYIFLLVRVAFGSGMVTI